MKLNLKLAVPIVVFMFSTLHFVSCKTIPISELSQDDGIARIKSNYEDKEWAEVIKEVDEYKTRYPYSSHIQEADLMQANAFYNQEKFPEAIASYEDLIRKNPRSDNAAFVHYRIGKCFDLQAPDNLDRDQSNSRKALAKYNYFIENFPNTEWVTDAKLRKEVLNRRIANHSAFIANFYWNKDIYAGALTRYLEIIKNYSEYEDLIKIAKERASTCYKELAKILEKNPQSDAYVYFNNETPESLNKKADDIRK